MKKIVITIASALAFIPLCIAEEQPGHFKGKESATLEAALTNLTEGNAKLVTLLKKETLEPKDVVEIHEMSYTLEKALAKVGEEQARLAELLEEVHLASEIGDGKKVKDKGAIYLEASAPLVR